MDSSSSSTRSKSRSIQQSNQVDIETIVDEAINDRNWTESRRATDGPYANGIHMNSQDMDTSQQTTSMSTTSSQKKRGYRTYDSEEEKEEKEEDENRNKNVKNKSTFSSSSSLSKPLVTSTHKIRTSSRTPQQTNHYVPAETPNMLKSKIKTKTKEGDDDNDDLEIIRNETNQDSPSKRSRKQVDTYEPWNRSEKKAVKKASTAAPLFGKSQRSRWTVKETEALIKGRAKHKNNWCEILNDPNFEILVESGRTNINLKDRARVLDGYGATLETFHELLFDNRDSS